MSIFAVYKPKGMTSHDVVNIVRRATNERRVGHAGTLDPLAEGVLVLAVGRASTKTLADVVAKEKEYIATIRFGATSTTDDAEGEIRKFQISNLKLQMKRPIEYDIRAILQTFIGEIDQVPPVYSALKIKGTNAYARARRGETVEMQSRRVRIDAIELLSYAWPECQLRVVTGPGVYIRSLARDLGAALGVGGYLTGLIRTRVGQYTAEKTHRIINGTLTLDIPT